MNDTRSSGWLLMLVISILFSLLIGLCMVRMSIERAETAFRITQLQHDLTQRTALNVKLEVERDRFLVPGDLRRRAETLGLRPAAPGQIRRLSLSETLPSQDSRRGR